ncbi:unnamed protein product [Rotaria magnacalcarata]|uniref:Uncharacterized protein n=1 Tax=Rotaria magnacalcarata TaxID=392030 RepID=A0A819WIA2_9BILA|nr:unnamed protein product [Rotaria magnacalcarata]CAF4124037.1 unnamed protein product [Rotaria magnacalcarata]
MEATLLLTLGSSNALNILESLKDFVSLAKFDSYGWQIFNRITHIITIGQLITDLFNELFQHKAKAIAFYRSSNNNYWAT